MANKIDPKDVVSVEEVLLSNAIEHEALVTILIKSGLIRKRELLEEIKNIRNKLQVNS